MTEQGVSIMAKLYLADKDTLDAVNTKVGTTTDNPSSTPTTLFSGIRYLSSTLASHIAAWTAARATKLDNLDAKISTRAPANTALSTAVWSSNRAAGLDKLGTGVIFGIVTNVQFFSGSVTGSAVTQTPVEIFNVSGKGEVVLITSELKGCEITLYTDSAQTYKKPNGEQWYGGVTLIFPFTKSIQLTIANLQTYGGRHTVSGWILFKA